MTERGTREGIVEHPVVRAWTVEDAERLKFLYIHGSDKGDMPLRHIAEELGRTEAACRSKLHRIYCANAPSTVSLPDKTMTLQPSPHQNQPT